MDLAFARQVNRLFKQALDQPEDQRERFLASECAGNPALLSAVRALLDRLDDAEQFLETPALQLEEPPQVDDPVHNMIGTRIGRYTIEAIIASGGMGTVFLARQERPNREVALKIMRTGLVSKSMLRRFEFEAEALGRLQHPHIAQVYEAATHHLDGFGQALPYFALEYVPGGQTLVDYSASRNLELRERLALFIKVCEAVHHGHQKGVIHRDLKPANILVNRDGVPKVIDFGIARLTGQDVAGATMHTTAGEIVGTLEYMSPEQSAADPNAIDTRSDVYALGVVLYELVCGRTPHDLKNISVYEATRVIREQPPVKPSTIVSALRGDLETIILKALQKDPQRRYLSAVDLAQDLQRFLNHQPIEARPTGMFYHLRMFTRRHLALVGSAVAALIILIAGVTVSTTLAVYAGREAERRARAEARAIDERDAAVWHAYVADIAAAESALRANEFRRLRARLASAPEVHRGWEWRYLQQRAEPSLMVLQGHEGMLQDVDYSPNGELIVTGGRDNTVRVWHAESGALRHTLRGHTDWVHDVAFSPDGRMLASGSFDHTIRWWDAESGAPLEAEPVTAHEDHVWDIGFNPQGDLLASGGKDNTLRLWHTRTRRPHWVAETSATVSAVAFSADGKMVAAGCHDGRVRWWAVESGKLVGEIEIDLRVNDVIFGPRSRRIFIAANDGHIHVHDTAEGVQLMTLAGHDKNVRRLAVAPRLGRLASGGDDHTIRMWDLVTGAPRGILHGHTSTVYSVAFNPQQTRLVSAAWDYTARIWRIATNSASTVIEDPSETVYDLSFSPDGRLLASAASDGNVRLYDAKTFRLLRTIKHPNRLLFCAAFSADSRWLATSWSGGLIKIWDSCTADEVMTLSGHDEKVNRLAFDPQGRFLVSGSLDHRARIWDLSNGQTIHVLEGHGGRIWDVAVSPDGRRVATAAWDLTAKVWEASSGLEIATLRGHREHIYGIVFSPDGQHVITGSRDQTIRIWNAANGSLVQTLKGHGQFVTSLKFSPDGQRLASASWWGNIMLWRRGDYDAVITLNMGHQDAIRALAFSPDGTQIVTGSQDTTVRILDERSPGFRRQGRQAVRAMDARAEVLVREMLQGSSARAAVAEQLWQDRTLDPLLRTAALNRLLMEP